MMHEDYHFFSKGPFSQWHKTDIYYNGRIYNCCEQFMMAAKAILFNDHDTYDMIMGTKNPREQKDYGRMVKNFDQARWDDRKENIVFTANLLKFTQNTHLELMLIDTHPKIIVEASPWDKIWGIGLSEEDALKTPPHEWKGLNLLGQQLMIVRDCLIAGHHGESFVFD